MITLSQAGNRAPMLCAAVLMLCGTSAFAQNTPQPCKSAGVIPLTGTEPAPKIVVNPPLAEPLASRGVVIIPYCAENMRFAPMFGPGALKISPRVGHVHVSVDDTPWRWADASGNPIILAGLTAGPHKVLIELMNPNHQVVDKATVTFEVPKRSSAGDAGAVDTKVR
jgi:Family of unknown function (DUF6130)